MAQVDWLAMPQSRVSLAVRPHRKALVFRLLPKPMSDQVIQEIHSADGKLRLLICQRQSGSFYYESQHFSEHEHEMCWIADSRQSIGIYESQSTALREARGNIDWLMIDAEQGAV